MVKINEIEFQQLNFESRRGALCAAFTESDFFKLYLHPYLKEAVNSIALQNLDIPQKTQDIEMIAILSAVNSGKKDFVLSFLTDLQAWADAGDVAAKKLEKVEEIA